jgi:hypothetical protein
MIVMKKDYYVYIHYRKSNPLEPFYVGKGKNGRAWSEYDRNPYWKHIVNKDKGFRCEIVYRGLSEDEAYAKEIFIVALYGRKDLGTGTLVNMTDGGDGSSPSEETRKKISEAQKGKTPSEETRKKLSESLKGEKNPRFGKKHSEETRKKIREAAKRQHENKRLND